MEFRKAAKSDLKNAKLRQLYNRSHGLCFYCEELMHLPPRVKRGSDRYPSTDHFIPTSNGGAKDISNCVAAHVKCNNEKANSVPSAPLLLRFDDFIKGRWPSAAQKKAVQRRFGVDLRIKLSFLTTLFYLDMQLHRGFRVKRGLKRGPWLAIQIHLGRTP